MPNIHDILNIPETAGHQIACHSKYRKDTQYSYACDYSYKRNRPIQLPVDDTWSGPLVAIWRTGYSHIPSVEILPLVC